MKPTCRNSGLAPLFLCLLPLSLVSTAGCNNKTEYAAPSLQPAVPAATQEQAKKLVEQFASAVDHKDYAVVRRMMSPALQAKSPATFDKWLEEGQYQPLIGGTAWQYNQIEYGARGKKVVVHSNFTGANGNNYRTNIAFVNADKSADQWRIDLILQPTKPERPAAAQGSTASTTDGATGGKK